MKRNNEYPETIWEIIIPALVGISIPIACIVGILWFLYKCLELIVSVFK